MELGKLIEQYLKDTKIMQLTTVKDGLPWICTVNFVADGALNLYWMSMRNTRHSTELVNNPSVAVAVVVDTHNKRGLQMQGKAYEVKGKELLEIHKIYCERYGDKKERLNEAQSGKENSRAYYKFVPSRIELFDEANTSKQELNLS